MTLLVPSQNQHNLTRATRKGKAFRGPAVGGILVEAVTNKFYFEPKYSPLLINITKVSFICCLSKIYSFSQ